jgi:hypothetical protein
MRSMIQIRIKVNIRIRTWILMKVKIWIRIRTTTKVIRIRNPAEDLSNLEQNMSTPVWSKRNGKEKKIHSIRKFLSSRYVNAAGREWGRGIVSICVEGN